MRDARPFFLQLTRDERKLTIKWERKPPGVGDLEDLSLSAVMDLLSFFSPLTSENLQFTPFPAMRTEPVNAQHGCAERRRTVYGCFFPHLLLFIARFLPVGCA